MAARHCESCLHDWPANTDFHVCPFCETQTTYRADKAPMTKTVAAYLVDKRDKALADAEADWKRVEELAAVSKGHLTVADIIEATRAA